MTDLSCARQHLERGRQDSGLEIHDLWLECFALGFTGSVDKLQDILDGTEILPSGEYDLIAHCLNERLRELEKGTAVPYAEDIDV